MKKYIFEIVITEGNDEYWEGLAQTGNPGCEDILENLREALRNDGFSDQYDTEIRMVEFSDRN